jgi:hypothetical protein
LPATLAPPPALDTLPPPDTIIPSTLSSYPSPKSTASVPLNQPFPCLLCIQTFNITNPASLPATTTITTSSPSHKQNPYTSIDTSFTFINSSNQTTGSNHGNLQIFTTQPASLLTKPARAQSKQPHRALPPFITSHQN